MAEGREGGGSTAGEPLVLHVRPDTFEWGSEEDDRWRTDLADLGHRLRRELPEATVDPGVQEGNRGPAELTEIILALGSAGFVTAAVEVIKSWIGAKPGRRKVKVLVTAAGREESSVIVDADGLGASELHDLAVRALGNVNGNSGAGDARSR